MIIDNTSIHSAILQDLPFPHAFIHNFIKSQTYETLLKNFPANGFFCSKRLSGSDKTYLVDNHILFALENQRKSESIINNPNWCALIDAITSVEYKEAVSALFNVNLKYLPMEITLKRYQKEHHISPHTDREESKATHLIFFNDHWKFDWGGELCLMSSAHKIENKIPPLRDNSIIFLRTEDSWHAVTECQAPIPRIALQVVFWRSKQRTRPDGREEVPY